MGEQHEYSATLHSLGILAQLRGKYSEAEQFVNKALDISRSLGEQGEIAYGFAQLGSLSRVRGRLEEAERYLSNALEILSKIGDEPGRRRASDELADIRAELRANVGKT